MAEMRHFVERNSRVLVVEPQPTIRFAVSQTLKKIGFGSVKSLSDLNSIADFFKQSEGQYPNWILTSLCLSERVNAFQLLKLVLETKALRDCRVSFMIEDSERFTLDNAFELGLLSWHTKPFSSESFVSDIKHLSRILSENSFSCFAASASYLRKYLVSGARFSDAVNIQKATMELLPSNFNHVLDLAEIYFLQKRFDEGKNVIAKARFLDSKITRKAQDLIKKYCPDEKDAEGESFGTTFSINNCVAVDDRDAASLAVIKSTMMKVGIPEVTCFDDATIAWEFFEKSSPESVNLIFLEWRLTKISGLALIQRLRYAGYCCPVFVTSSLVRQKDMDSLEEVGVSGVIEKPLTPNKLKSTVISRLVRDGKLSQAKVMERRIQHLLAEGNIAAASELKERLFSSLDDVPEETRLLVEASFLFHANQFEEARQILLKLLHSSRESLPVLNLLARVFMKLGEPDAAIMFFDRANALSPNNVERLCDLAIVQAENGDTEKADKLIEKATEIDTESQEVADASATIAIMEGDTEKARNVVSNMKSLAGFIANMNNRAVALVHQGLLEKSMELYKRALMAVDDNRTYERGILHFNLGLTYIRLERLEDGIKELEKVIKIKDHYLLERADRIRKQAIQGVKANAKVKLTLPGEVEHDANAVAKKKAAVEISDFRILAHDVDRGELCCHKVFFAPGGMDQRVKRFLEKTPPLAFE